MTKTNTLMQAFDRNEVGTGSARSLRRKGLVPAIIYGSGKPQVLISLNAKNLNLEFHKQGFLSHMFDIEISGKTFPAIPKAFKLNPVTDEIEHIDFIHINENLKIKVNVTLHFINESKCPGIKQGGVLNVIKHDIEIYCLPGNIPQIIEIDIANLSVGQSIHVKDLKLPEGIETKLDLESTIAALVAGSVEQEVAETDKK